MSNKLRLKRKRRIKAKIRGTRSRPRLSVFRSNRKIYGQIINDESGDVLVSASDFDLKKEAIKKPKNERARGVGKILAEKAIQKKIKKVVFDRQGYPYHGRVKALAEAARKSGLKF